MKQNSVTPLHDRVIILPDETKKETSGGIIIPDTAKEKPVQGTVFSVGKGTVDNPLTVKEGDTVLYNKNAGSEIYIEDVRHLIMKESDILAIL